MSNDELILLQQRLLDHIEEYNIHRETEDKRWKDLMLVQERNNQSIKELTESTRDLISAWDAATGTVRAMSALGKFVKWLSGFAIIGVIANWFVEYIK